MSEKLFYKLDALGTTARNPVNKTNNTNPYKDSILFDKQRGTVWTGGDEYGNNLTYSNFNEKIFNGSALSDAKIGGRTITHTKSLFDAIEAVQLTYIENQGITLVQGDTYKGTVKFKLTNIFSYPGNHTYDHSEYGLKLEIDSYTVAKIGYLYAKNADSVTLHYPVSRTINSNTDPNFSSNPKMYLPGVVPSGTLSTSRKDETDHWLYVSNGSAGQEFPYIQWDTDTSTYILNASGLRVDHLNVGVNITNNGSSGLTVGVGGSSDNVTIEGGSGISISAATGGDGLKISHSTSNASNTTGNGWIDEVTLTDGGHVTAITRTEISVTNTGNADGKYVKNITKTTGGKGVTASFGTLLSGSQEDTKFVKYNYLDGGTIKASYLALIANDTTSRSNYYVEKIGLDSNGQVIASYTQLVDTTVNNVASSGKYISKIENSSGHIKAAYTDLLDNSTTAASGKYISDLEISSGKIKATYTSLPTLSVNTTTGSNNQYISALTVNDHKITATYTSLPTLSVDTTTGSSGQYISATSVSGHTITHTYTDLLSTSTSAASNYYISKLEIASGHIKATYTQLPLFSLTENVVNSSDNSTTIKSEEYTYIAIFKNGETTHYLRSYFTNDGNTGILITGETPSGKDPMLKFTLNSITLSNPTTGNNKGKLKVSIGNQDSGFVTVSANSSFTYDTAKGLYTTIGSIAGTAIECKLTTSGSSTTGKIGLSIGGNAAGAAVTVPFATEATTLTNKPSLSYDGGLKVTAGGKTSDACYFGLSYSSGGLKLRVASTDISTLQVRLLQGGSNDKVKLKIGSTDTGEVTINNVEIASKIKTVTLSGETGLDPGIIKNYYEHFSNTTSDKNERKNLTNYLKNETVQKSIFWLTPSTYSINNGTAIYESFAYNNYIQPNSNEYMSLSSNAPHIIYSGGQVFMFTPFTISAEIWSENIHGNNFYGTLYGNADTATSATSATNVNLSLSYSTSTGLTVKAGTGTAGVVACKLATSGRGSSAKIGLRIGGNTAGSDITVPYATTAGSADSATTAGSATSAANAEKVLINADQYDTLTSATVEDAVIKLAEQDDPTPMELLRAAKLGITPVVFASNEKSSKYIFESGVNNSLWANPLTSQASLTNNGPFILHNNGKPDILYSQVIGANKIYGKVFTGNAATATSATTAAGFTGTVSLQNASNQLKVTVGSTTSSGLTIAYATNADTVDGKHVSCVTALPSSPDTNTIYIIT